MRTDRRTELTKLIFAFRNFAKSDTNSTFYQYSVFMCLVRIAEQKAIISIYSVYLVGLISESECVYCTVRTESVTIIEVYFHF
jgi:hypothetical protein